MQIQHVVLVCFFLSTAAAQLAAQVNSRPRNRLSYHQRAGLHLLHDIDMRTPLLASDPPTIH